MIDSIGIMMPRSMSGKMAFSPTTPSTPKAYPLITASTVETSTTVAVMITLERR
ncbi:hypothetical protein [Nonomuraea sp. NPDC049750]|uniref:hypothetical protein n=1 Tax=Nonomuraea sp. NPDC049750 TaxID=3154738 RepID=UPI0033CAAD30